MQLRFTFQHILCLVAVLFGGTAMAQISIPNGAFTDNQDFNSLANTGTSSTVPAGWAFVETGANANVLYTAGTGGSNAGDTYSFGLASPSTERAFGGLLSGNLTPTVGVCYTNNTGGIITGFTVTYTGETWRVGTASRTDGIQFQYNQSTTAINGAGTWTSFPGLDYFNPGQATGNGSMLHSALITSPVSGLSIQPGATFCFRWNDFNASGGDDGIGVDDYSLSALTVVPTNDDCANATPIGCTAAVSGNNINATDDSGAFSPCGVVQTTNGVWYTITGNGGSITVSTCAGATFDTKISVYSGSCAAPTCVGGNDDSCGTSSEFTFASVNGQTYYIMVHGFAGSSGDFILTTTCSVPPVVLNCPINTTAASCQTQAAVNAQFNAWLATANGTGGCDGVLTNNNTGAPAACGGSTTVTFTYTSTCAPLTTTCQATFTVAAPPTIVLTCPINTTAAACQTQAAINTAFSTWLATASGTGGCNGVLANNNTGAPPACGGSTTVTFTYTSTCAPLTTTCTATFTVAAPGPFTLPPNSNATVACPANATQPVPPVVTDACGTVLTPTGPTVVNAPNPVTCEGTRTYSWTYTDCANNMGTWSFIYTIERNPFTVPVFIDSSRVACLSLAVQPTPPTVTSNCGEVLTPTVSFVDNPNPLTCEGSRVYTFSYLDCEGNTGIYTYLYRIERLPFTVPANGSSTVACLANAVPPALPTVTSNCGEVLTPGAPVITDNPNPLTCEGTRTYAYTYTDCEGNTATWSFVYTIEREPFILPANGAAQVACPADATPPVPPVVASNCGEVLTPVGPVVTNVPNPLTCEGTRTYVWTYTDCEGNTTTWSFVYTIEREPFTIAVADGSAVVDCPDDTDLVPTPPVVTSNCGEVLTPVITSTAKNACEGDRIYYFTYTDCEGNTAIWQFRYTVEYLDFSVPASEVVSVECPLNATLPTPPVVFDNCGRLLNPSGPVTTTLPNAFGCDGSRSYAWTYTDCEGNTHIWSKRYNFLYSGDFFAPANQVDQVSCLAYAVAPFPPVLFDFCGQEIQIIGPTMTQNIVNNGCSGTRTYSYTYRDCGGHTKPWTYTYIIEDNQPPVGTCPSGNSPVSVDVTNLACIEDVPCPDDYNFNGKIQELIAAGNYYDVCYGSQIFVTLVDDSGLWECSDPDGDGDFTFGRTFYFQITDRCGNAHPSLCEVTYSGACQPLETFSMAEWGIEGGAPGNTISSATTDLSVITTLLGSGPVAIGGANRSITVNDAQCMMNLLPGTGGPAILSNCQQVNCTGGCNPLGIGGLKNALAANALALELNIRYNTQYNGLTRTNIRNQHLGCIDLHPCIVYCDATGNCRVHFFDAAGNELAGAYTIGGLQDLVNIYLNAGSAMTIGQKVIYGTALNESLLALNDYFNSQAANACDNAAPDFSNIDKLFNEYNLDFANGTSIEEEPNFEIAPNPASNDVNVRLTGLTESAEVSLEVFNALGQKVIHRKLGAVDFVNEQLDIRSLGNGIYFVQVNAGETRFEEKLIIARD